MRGGAFERRHGTFGSASTSVGFELFEPETGIPEGGTEQLVRMTYRQSD